MREQASRAARHMGLGGASESAHGVQLYDSDALLEKTVGAFLAEGLRRGESIVVVATRAHWAGFRRRLFDDGAPLDVATRGGRVVVLDAEQALSWIEVGGSPDRDTFRRIVDAAFAMLARSSPQAPVRAYGEMVDLLWQADRLTGAIALERLWDEALERRPMPLLCAYQMDGPTGRRARAAEVEAICAAHTHVGRRSLVPCLA